MKCAMLAVQQAIFAALQNDAPLVALAGIFDDVPKGTVYPYISIGDMHSHWWGALGVNGEEVSITISVWSQYLGYAEALNIADNIQRILGSNMTLSVSGYSLEMVRFDSGMTNREGDGITRSVELIYRVSVLENT